MSVPNNALRCDCSSASGRAVVESNKGFLLAPAESLVSIILSVPKMGFAPCMAL